MATTNQKPNMSSPAGTGEKPSLMLFGGLAMIALLKDLLDFIGIGSLPVIGTVVTLCFSFLIFMLLLLFDRSGGRWNKRVAQGLVMTFFTLVEAIGFVLNFLPLQTLTIVFLYNISYRSWKEAQNARTLNQRILTKKQKVQQVRMYRAMAQQEQTVINRAGVPANVEAQTSSQTISSPRDRAPQATRVTTLHSPETRVVQKVANDAVYQQRKAA